MGNHFKRGRVSWFLLRLSQMRMPDLPACSCRTMRIWFHVMNVGFGSWSEWRMVVCADLPLTCTGTPSATCKRAILLFHSMMPKNVGAYSGKTTSHIGFDPTRFLPGLSQDKP